MTHTHDTCTRNLSYLSPVCLQVQFMCEYIFSKRANIFYGITFYDKKWIISYWQYLRMSHIEHTPCAISSLINTWHSSAYCLSGRCTVNCCLQRNIYLIRKHVAKIFHSNSTWMSHKKKGQLAIRKCGYEGHHRPLQVFGFLKQSIFHIMSHSFDANPKS